MTTYTCTFAFAGASVLLIRKARPDWQKGLLNGIGGKVERGETIIGATIREFREETDLWDLPIPSEGPAAPQIYHSMLWPEYESHTNSPLVYFSGFTIPPRSAAQAVQNTLDRDEPCVLWPVEKITTAPSMPNVPFLVAMAKCLVLCTPEERRLRQPLVWDERTIRENLEYGALVR